MRLRVKLNLFKKELWMKVIKIIERIVFALFFISFVGDCITGYIQGYNKGFLGISSSAEPSILFDNLWVISTLLFIIIKLISCKLNKIACRR